MGIDGKGETGGIKVFFKNPNGFVMPKIWEPFLQRHVKDLRILNIVI